MGGSGTGKTSAAKARRRMEIAQRRRMVALLLRVGLEQQEIAAQLKVSEGTISSDVTALKAALREEAQQDIAEMVRSELQSLDGDEAYWRGQMHEAVTQAGRSRAYDQVMTIERRRAELMGLDAQQRRLLEHGRGGSALLDELLRSLVGGESDGVGPSGSAEESGPGVG